MPLFRAPVQRTLQRTFSALLFALAASAAQAQTPSGWYQLQLRANAYHDNDSFYERNSSGQPISAAIQAEDITGDTVSGMYGSVQQARARGAVDPTRISLYSWARSYAQSSSPHYSAFADASAQAIAQTPFLIQGGGAPGSLGTLVATLEVSGSVTVDPGFYDFVSGAEARGQAAMYFWATGLNASGCTYYVDAGCLDIERDYNGDRINSNNALRTWTLHIPFNFDHWSSFTLQMWTMADSFVTANGTGGWLQHHAVSDFAHTLRWGGITAVLDAQGQPVSGWNISSLPGLDLTVAAVPEPAEWLMLLSGGLFLVWRRLPRRR